VNVTTAAINTCDLRPADRVVCLAPPHVDASLGEILPALVAGAALLPGADTTSAAAFWESCQETTVLYLPTGFWHDLVAASQPSMLPHGLRLVVIGGEPAEPEAVADWARLTRDRVRLVNTYGAAETAITAVWGDVKLDVFRAVPLGRPIPNAHIYVLDGQMQPVPVGLPGEICVGGVGLARGYHHRPDLTAARFVPNPFRPGERLFRTGDLGRLRPDGSLEFVGRVDDRVKINGFRVEPGEIAAALRACSGVIDAAVIPQSNGQLVGYLVCENGQSAADLHNRLAGWLPPYMLPADIVTLDDLPLRPDGVLDRAALPDPGCVPTLQPPSPAAPRNAVEDRLTELWANLLGVSGVGIRDNFFDLGGHSLLAARLIAQVERDFGQPVSLAALFDSPTIEEMASALAERIWNAPWSSLVPIRPGGTRPPLFLAHSFGGDVVQYYNLLPHLDADLPVYGLRAQGLDGRTPPDRRIEDMAARYVSELRAIQPQGPYTLGGYEMGGLIALEMARQLDQAGEPVALLAILDTLIIPDLSALIDLPFVDKNLNRAQRALLILRKLASLPWEKKLPYLRAMVDVFITGENHDHPRPPAQRAVEAAMREALVHYELQPYSGPVTLFLSRERETNYIVNPLPAWQRVARGGLTVHEVPGTHHRILLEPHVATLGAQLSASLAQAVDSDQF
jgi:thioesterase domain-containing protein